ncbi:dihydrolipoamide acetyltransferase family protein [Amycolatopsis regifaucium]|uniref:Dihydrolipoamide acetyltransferase component of pyruvate dehydrogenase complex n=1 Tax=Amycolatopsis regifaucium TaxID=546365 RepID=A0A154MP23_9PSEU|nr:dihydrolipoamide acetyltransferase family protein [Amycolatopsis regifaucium]KZB86058.1 branched-chain alpha-keto acid dehydrogenase subunit E2 [Amycolatopsis regifaucium]OKA04950.1 branched-chain alpha-keto acid dehydrogenase subunit E2 [Amycolatopsis regifaucium]SFH76306.1 pyruvate dehydrogenase E2 component (dihydrolipoamide acetyltransferase) [Amycolatopsis regifaucium]
MPDFLLPDLGEGLTEASIVNWLVAEGDTVGVDQPVVEVETAKAAVEVPVPFAGVVTRLHGEPGQSLPVGAPLLSIGPGFTEPGVTTASEGSGNVLIGYGTTTTTRRRRTRTVGATPEKPSKTPGVISPFVRKMAADHKIDLTKLTGSGPGGIIRRADVEAALTAVPEQRDGEKRIPLTGVRKAVADKLTASRRQIPEATVWVDVDATGLVAARKSLNASAPDRPVSLLGLIARFAVAGLRKYPELNSRVEGDEIVQLREINLGFAAQTERGLVVPVVRDAGSLSTRELSAAIRERTTQAREGKPSPAGGTFTVNNYGVFGVDGSAAIINHPEAAILGIGRIIDRAWVVDGALVPRKICELTLAFDHRVCDGGTAGGFLRFVADCVESPVTALGDL